MKRRLLTALGLVCGPALCGAGEFEPPVRLTADGQPVRVESPGYACPCWADLTGKGKPDLLVGQFRGGKVRVYKHLGGLKFEAGKWLQAGGKDAEIPGVW